MNIGLFESLSNHYFTAGQRAYDYAGRLHWLFKIIFYPLALFIQIGMMAGGVFFRLFIVFDWISNFVNGLRRSVLNTLQNLQHNIPHSFWAFIINPILIVMLAPVFFVCAILPKFSSSMPGAVGDAMDEFSSGAFGAMNRVSWGSANNLFNYVANAPLLLKPITGIIAIFSSIILIVTGAAFFVLIILDKISGLIEKMRVGLVNWVHSVAQSGGRSFFHFFASPMLMAALVPVLVIVLIIPKFSSGMD